MRSTLTAGLAALVLGVSVAATATPAAADPHWCHGGWHGGGWHEGWGWRHHDDDDAGWAIGAGLAGLAIGAALASDHPHYYHRYYYYDEGPYYYDYGPATCVGHRRIWDPYLGGYIIRRFYYAC